MPPPTPRLDQLLLRLGALPDGRAHDGEAVRRPGALRASRNGDGHAHHEIASATLPLPHGSVEIPLPHGPSGDDGLRRPLDPVYAVLHLDAFPIRVGHERGVLHKTLYLATGVALDGRPHRLGHWIAEAEGTGFWLAVLASLQRRGLTDVLIGCADAHAGLAQALAMVFPRTHLQPALAGLVRRSLPFVGAADRRAVARDLRAVYRAPTAAAGRAALARADERWGATYPVVARAWERRWPTLEAFFACPAEIRQVLAIPPTSEAVGRALARVASAPLPSDAAVLERLGPALRGEEPRTRSVAHWPRALNRLAVDFAGRVPLP